MYNRRTLVWPFAGCQRRQMRQTSLLFSHRPVIMPSSLTKVPSFSICSPETCPMNFSPLLNVQTTLPSINPPLKCPSTSIMRFSRSFANGSSTSLPQPCNFPLRHSPWYTVSLPSSSLPNPEGFSHQLQLPTYSSPPTKVILMNLSWILSLLRACRLAALMCFSSSMTARTGSSRLTASLTLDLNLLEAMLVLDFPSSSTYSSLDCAMAQYPSLPWQMFYWLSLSSILRIRLILLMVSLPFFCSTDFRVVFMPWLLQFFRNFSASWQLSIWQLQTLRFSWLPALVALGDTQFAWLASSISSERSDCMDMVRDRSCSLTSLMVSSPSNLAQSSPSAKSTIPPSLPTASEPTEFLIFSTCSASTRTLSSFSAFCQSILVLLFFSSSSLMEWSMHWFLRKEFSSLRRATSSISSASAAVCLWCCERREVVCIARVFWIWLCVSASWVRQSWSCQRRNC